MILFEKSKEFINIPHWKFNFFQILYSVESRWWLVIENIWIPISASNIQTRHLGDAVRIDYNNL